jgi:acetyl esterase
MYVPRDSNRRNSPYVNPARVESLTGHPPALVVTAEVDPTRDCTEEYARRMQVAGADVVLQRYGGVMHGFGSLTAALPQARDALKLTAEFVGQRLRQGVMPAEG